MNQCPSLNDTDINWRCVSIIGQIKRAVTFSSCTHSNRSVVITNQNQSISAKSLCGTTGDCWWQVSIYYLLVFDKNAIPLSGNLKIIDAILIWGLLGEIALEAALTDSRQIIHIFYILWNYSLIAIDFGGRVSGNPVQGNLEKSLTRYFATTSNPSINYCRIIVLNSDQFEINVEAAPIVIGGETIISR